MVQKLYLLFPYSIFDTLCFPLKIPSRLKAFVERILWQYGTKKNAAAASFVTESLENWAVIIAYLWSLSVISPHFSSAKMTLYVRRVLATLEKTYINELVD